MSKVCIDYSKSLAFFVRLTTLLLLPVAFLLQGCMAIPAAALGGAPAALGLPPQGGGAAFATVNQEQLARMQSEAAQAPGLTDATTFALSVKSFAVGKTTMNQVQNKLGKPMAANKTSSGTSWIYGLADKTKAPYMSIPNPLLARSSNIYLPEGSGYLTFDNAGVLRGIQVHKSSMEGGVTTNEQVYSRGQTY